MFRSVARSDDVCFRSHVSFLYEMRGGMEHNRCAIKEGLDLSMAIV